MNQTRKGFKMYTGFVRIPEREEQVPRVLVSATPCQRDVSWADIIAEYASPINPEDILENKRSDYDSYPTCFGCGTSLLGADEQLNLWEDIEVKPVGHDVNCPVISRHVKRRDR